MSIATMDILLGLKSGYENDKSKLMAGLLRKVTLEAFCKEPTFLVAQ
jgi:hypothetical protein